MQARKPDFWAHAMPLYEVVTPDGLMRPAMNASRGGLYCGGSATMVRPAPCTTAAAVLVDQGHCGHAERRGPSAAGAGGRCLVAQHPRRREMHAPSRPGKSHSARRNKLGARPIGRADVAVALVHAPVVHAPAQP